MRIGLVGVESSHAEDFLRHLNSQTRHHDIAVTTLWGGDPSRTAELLALVPDVVAVDSLDQLIADVDAVIVSDRHGDLHLPHALPAIAARRPVFINKPFTCTLEDAIALVDAADHARTPLLSASALRWQTETAMLRQSLASLPGPFAISGHGTWYPESPYGGAIFYAIHTIELLQELLGTGWSNLRLEAGDHPTVRYDAGPARVTLQLYPLGPGGSAEFGVSVQSPQLTSDTPIPLGPDYMAPVTDRIAAMLRTGIGMDRETLLAPIRMMAEIEALLGRR